MAEQHLVFIPVSSKKGIGEYMRSTIIATYFRQQNPNVHIHFILNENAPYVDDCEFQTHLVPASPTNCTEQVNDILSSIKPNIVVFDASGRAKQMKHAKDLGAKVVFISQHPKKRAKGLSLGRIRQIDHHLVAQPSFSMTPLSIYQKAKLTLFNKPAPECLGCLYIPVEPKVKAQALAQFDLEEQNYMLVSAGSGGHKFDGELAADVFAKIAKQAAEHGKLKVIMVYGSSYPNPLPQSEQNVISVKSMANADFIALLSGAKCALLSGGGSLLQAVSLAVPTVVTPVAKDQPSRINACAEQNLTLAAEANTQALLAQVQNLFVDDKLTMLKQNLLKSNLTNGLPQVVGLLNTLLSD